MRLNFQEPFGVAIAYRSLGFLYLYLLVQPFSQPSQFSFFGGGNKKATLHRPLLVLRRYGSSGMLTLHCPPGQVYPLTGFLRERGPEAVSVAELDYVFSKDNPLYAKLEKGL